MPRAVPRPMSATASGCNGCTVTVYSRRRSGPPSRSWCCAAILRQRQMLLRYAGQHIQHMQKALEEMNVKLPEVVSNIAGVTGLAIIRAILAGQRDPLELAKLRNDKCRRTQA